MIISVKTIITGRIVDAKTKRVVKEQTKTNLVLDTLLNGLAQSGTVTYPAACSLACRVGSGTNPTSVSSGAITFTQVGTTLTASGGFFNSGMVGTLFKYGVGSAGAEYYITAFTNTTTVTVDTSATVAAPDVGTVWYVNQTTLQTLVLSSATYETSAGSCQTTFSGSATTHKRTINFPVQGSPYTVNEIGYYGTTAGTGVYGRVVLASSDVVAPTNFYQVVITIVFTYSPGTPTAVSDVGTNINTAGTAMLETLNSTSAFHQVQSTGVVSGVASALDAANTGTCAMKIIIAAYTQNSVPGSVIATTTLAAATANWTYAGTRGKMTVSYNASFSTAAQSMRGVGLTDGSSNIMFDIKLTTPFTLPSGTFLPQVVFSMTYNRALVN